MKQPASSCPGIAEPSDPPADPGAPPAATPLVAYLVNQYPKPSVTFIRREIRALEAQGIAVRRFALRGWEDRPLDADDVEEQARTCYLLRNGATAMALAALREIAIRPQRFLAALFLALRLGRRSERGLLRHLAYLGEACRLAGLLRESHAGHLHAHFGTNSTTVAMLTRALGGPPYSFTVHGPEEFDAPRALALPEKIRRADFVVAVSTFGRSQLCRWAEPGDWERLAVVHCGVDAPYLRAPLTPPPQARRLVCVGRLCAQKGQLLLIEAARQLTARGVSFELVLAGDGELHDRIEVAIHQAGLASRVRITGWIDGPRVREEILAARALVLPSFAEGLPVVLMEAMALRRPVISTYVAGIPELVVAGESGWLVPAGSVEALVAAMEEALECSPERLAAMGNAARLRVLSRHSVDVEAAILARLFARGDSSPAAIAGEVPLHG
jgi:glycosyltransferase involved in cell wall biosynthesis